MPSVKFAKNSEHNLFREHRDITQTNFYIIDENAILRGGGIDQILRPESQGTNNAALRTSNVVSVLHCAEMRLFIPLRNFKHFAPLFTS
jgi:hypothetical protein